MINYSILWVDDEIESLKSHILFLKDKGFSVNTVSNGYDAIDIVSKNNFDLIFLDENMPGLSGLDTLTKLKEITGCPMIMITKSEQEHIMEDAIGSKIADYLIKPVNPNQILLSIKKNLNQNEFVTSKTNSNYQKQFMSISSSIGNITTFSEWVEVYKKIIYWELELESIDDSNMLEILLTQKKEANNYFFKFIIKKYKDLLNNISDNRIIMSHDLTNKFVKPLIINEKPTFFLLIDNLRLDQWMVISPLLKNYFLIDDNVYCSILHINAILQKFNFSSLTLLEISKKFPQYWLNDNDEGGKNLFEEKLLINNFKGILNEKDISFHKVFNNLHGQKIIDKFNELLSKKLNVIIYNFVDILSHAKTDVKMIKELTGDEKAYRDLTITWFKNSPLFELLKILSNHDINLIITSDHGTINVTESSKVIGEKSISSNLRYKTGRKIKFDNRDVFHVSNPESIMLPSQQLSSSYIFAAPYKYFVYPNNYNHYAHHYINTYQHGGVSLDEMIIPIATLKPKK